MKKPTYTRNENYLLLKWQKLESPIETGGSEILYYILQNSDGPDSEFRQLYKEKLTELAIDYPSTTSGHAFRVGAVNIYGQG
jgi:hypothetical protein